jgi:hypothetical protein
VCHCCVAIRLVDASGLSELAEGWLDPSIARTRGDGVDDMSGQLGATGIVGGVDEESRMLG